MNSHMPKPIPYMTKLILHPPQHISHKPHPHKFALHPYKKPTSLTAPQRNKKNERVGKDILFPNPLFWAFWTALRQIPAIRQNQTRKGRQK